MASISIQKNMSAQVQERSAQVCKTPLQKFIKKVLKAEFGNLPRWVDRHVFMEDMGKELEGKIVEAYVYGDTELSTDQIGNFVYPLVSDKVDLEASGRKYDESYEFSDSLLEYLSTIATKRTGVVEDEDSDDSDDSD